MERWVREIVESSVVPTESSLVGGHVGAFSAQASLLGFARGIVTGTPVLESVGIDFIRAVSSSTTPV
jgi:hypothetical protein